MNWYKLCWAKYATFEGRARRSEYWFFNLFNIIAMFVFVFGLVGGILDGVFGTPAVFTGVLLGGYVLASFIPTVAVTVRRLHDTGRSGWWLLLSLIPVGGLVIFIFTVLDSADENDFGANPKLAMA